MRPHSQIKQPIVHAGEHSKDIMDWMIETESLKGEYTKPDNLTFVTTHNYVDDELGTAESKLHRYSSLYKSEDGRNIPIFEKSLEYLGIGLPTTISKPVCGHHINDATMIEKYGMYSHLMKEMWLLEHLKKGNNTELTMFCDAGDVILQDNPNKLIDIYEEYECDLLFMSTTYCQGNKGGYHDEFMQPMLNWQNSLQGGLYLNAGVFIGNTNFIIEVLERVLEFTHDKRFTQHYGYSDDQEILRYIHPEFYPLMKIDNKDGRRLAWRY